MSGKEPISPKQELSENRFENIAELPKKELTLFKEISFDRIETNPKFMNFDIKNLPQPSGKGFNVKKNWWTEISQEQFQYCLHMDGFAILNKITKKPEPNTFQNNYHEYGKWWNELGNQQFPQQFNNSFINIETDLITNKFFHHRSSHQQKYGLNVENDMPPPRRQYPLTYGRYTIFKKFPSVLFTRMNKNEIYNPSLQRVKKHLKLCTCPILEFTDLNDVIQIKDIELYNENLTELNNPIHDEEELKIKIFRLKVLLGLAVVYMIVKM